MTPLEVVQALAACLIYNLHWRWLSAERRFIKRNKLEARA